MMGDIGTPDVTALLWVHNLTDGKTQSARLHQWSTLEQYGGKQSDRVSSLGKPYNKRLLHDYLPCQHSTDPS